MKFSKTIARKVLFPLLMYLKIDWIIRKSSKGKVLIVMYHGVVESNSNYFSARHLDLIQFEKQIKYLKENFDIISTEEAFKYKRDGTRTIRPTISVTFDDGFANNLYQALPILEKYKVPATFYISSLCISDDNYKCLWSESIAALNYFFKNSKIEYKEYKFNNGFDKHKKVSLNDFVKNLNKIERDSFLNHLEKKYKLNSRLAKLPPEIWRLMTKDELKKLSRSSMVKIGTHAHNHYNLSKISFEEAKKDISQSKVLIDKLLNISINSIAFPDGDYNNIVKDFCASIGLKNMLAVNYKQDSDVNDDRILNRHGISSTTTFESNMIFLNLAYLKKGFRTDV